MADLKTALLQSTIRQELRQCRQARDVLYANLEENRAALAVLLKKGKTAGLGVTEMATLVELNRERVSELIHDKAPRARRGRPRKETP